MLWWKRLKKDDPEKMEKFKDEIEKEGGLEKYDMFAMIVSALLVLVPVALVVLIVMILIASIGFLL